MTEQEEQERAVERWLEEQQREQDKLIRAAAKPTKEPEANWGWGAANYLPKMYQNYRLSSTQFNAIWARQGGCCAGCKKMMAHPFTRDMNKWGIKCQVDHRHTGKQCEAADVRGLLCGTCNRFLGKIRDDLPLLKELISYLQQHGDFYGS